MIGPVLFQVVSRPRLRLNSHSFLSARYARLTLDYTIASAAWRKWRQLCGASGSDKPASTVRLSCQTSWKRRHQMLNRLDCYRLLHKRCTTLRSHALWQLHSQLSVLRDQLLICFHHTFHILLLSQKCRGKVVSLHLLKFDLLWMLKDDVTKKYFLKMLKLS